ncbi:hypothetical protein FSP39_010508 [Pinctada imbricata]|uniref:C2H2-type domain-containing protein n=1 Tax=Pinctada imbricata TaxID=66713 RepID=A0AA88YW01_PINIB|nr:hypothetical protein FSP39_010508 [Pinctada imbricata]
MPKKKSSNPKPPKPPLALLCEYEGCNQVFSCMEDFTAHITQHLGTYSLSDRPFAVQTFPCPWHLCGSRIQGLLTDFIRHMYFHSFHVKIKCLGQQMIDQDGLNSCTLDKSGRNLIPELPERLQCGWENCTIVLDIPETFYRHVDCHAHSYPEGNNVEGGCRCFWEGCDAVCKNKYKLREHLRSHTQEKIVACPVCGGLYSNRTKFLDHLKRQADSNVNQYKCPCCDMTCATPSSLKQHLRYRHTNEKPFQCEHCHFRRRTYRNTCVMCVDQLFSRGSKLTVHLKKKHKFRWPSGHCRFRYRMGEDGFWRLQTVRYESMHLTEQRSSTAPSNTESVSAAGSDKDHTGQAAACADVKQTLEVIDQNQNANVGPIGGVYKEYTEMVNSTRRK